MLQLLKIPKVQLTFTLLLIALTAILHKPIFSTFFVFFLAVSISIIFDLLFLTLRKIKLFIPYAAIVSGLIIGLLTSPQTPWYQIVIICAFAMAAKNFLRISERHIFNPAGIGLFMAGIVFHSTVSWWGVSFQLSAESWQSVFFFVVLLLPLLVSAYRMRRYNTIFYFFLAYIALSSIYKQSEIIDPTVIFFSAVMLPEPMTSPGNTKRQILYGICVALIVFILSTKNLSTDPLILALLLGNLIFFRYKINNDKVFS